MTRPFTGPPEQVAALNELKTQFTLTTDMLKKVAGELRIAMDSGLKTAHNTLEPHDHLKCHLRMVIVK
ncbi:unnamed protein product [Cunninghamella blakesleeana]